ncbi:hypothetical protein ACOMCU_00750 [Lysinibacillus sp. UGB7]|uniref:hypothetical protein n=1 Tax=Lysinibacillus sp. UGB7 TaxID=3411039 RepID=UPI003B80A8CC
MSTITNTKTEGIEKAKSILTEAYKKNEILNWEYDSLLYGVKRIGEFLDIAFEGSTIKDIQSFLAKHKERVDAIVQRELKGIYDEFIVQQLEKSGEVDSVKSQLTEEFVVNVRDAYEVHFEHPNGVHAEHAESSIDVVVFHNGSYLVDNDGSPLPVFSEEQVIFIIQALADYTSEFEIISSENDPEKHELYFKFESNELCAVTAFVAAVKQVFLQFIAEFGIHELRARNNTLTKEVIKEWGKN